MSVATNEPSRQWEELLSDGGQYQRDWRSPRELLRAIRMTRKLRFFLRRTKLRPPATVLELGCANGNQILPLAAAGYVCTGVDVSVRALENLTETQSALEQRLRRKLLLQAVHSDFVRYAPEERFDLVFHVGVLEHFLEADTRLSFLRHMFELTKPGGHVVHVVPNGQHPLRSLQRSRGLGGYVIPEIDYSVESLAEELRSCGGADVEVFPWNIYGYDLMLPRLPAWRRIRYYAWQLVPFSCLPQRLARIHGYWLAGFARKEPSVPCG